jgi:hypothetical protein
MGDENAFVTKVNPAGTSLVYSTYLGGSGKGSNGDRGNGIAVDGSGNAYVTGSTYSADFPLQDPIQSSFAGTMAAFVTKVNPAGTAWVYSTFLGGAGYSLGSGIAVDPAGNAFVTGDTSGVFPLLNPVQTFGGIFVTEVNVPGTAWSFSTLMGGSGAEEGLGISLDPGGGIYVCGNAFLNFTLVMPFQPVFAGSIDAFAFKISMLTATPTPSMTATVTPTPTATFTPAVTPSATATPPIRQCDSLWLSDNLFKVRAMGKTNIWYWLCESGWMNLVIYNTAGERVKTLRRSEYQTTLAESVEWDGTNDRGEPVASGVYLVHFERGNRSDTRKLAVLR